jgi:hypothetical protein
MNGERSVHRRIAPIEAAKDLWRSSDRKRPSFTLASFCIASQQRWKAPHCAAKRCIAPQSAACGDVDGWVEHFHA